LKFKVIGEEENIAKVVGATLSEGFLVVTIIIIITKNTHTEKKQTYVKYPTPAPS